MRKILVSAVEMETLEKDQQICPISCGARAGQGQGYAHILHQIEFHTSHGASHPEPTPLKRFRVTQRLQNLSMTCAQLLPQTAPDLIPPPPLPSPNPPLLKTSSSRPVCIPPLKLIPSFEPVAGPNMMRQRRRQRLS